MIGKAETETEVLATQNSRASVVADSELAGSPVESRQQGQFKY